MITIFKNIKEVNTPFYRTIDFVLKRIKEGNSKELINKIRSGNLDLKGNLPSICFCGKFTKRSDTAIIEHSGLVCLDFDKYESDDILLKDKEKIILDEYTYSCFISPSGNGLKVLVKIPKDVINHKKYFSALKNYYNNSHFDDTSSNLSRACFESYDENIYVNENSKLWETKVESEQFEYSVKPPTVKLTNENEIIKRLYKWFKSKYQMIEGQRNANLFILASSFSDFGVNDYEATRFCSQFQTDNFNQNEIELIIRSAYSRGRSNFGMKYFEDEAKYERIKKDIKEGASIADIKKIDPTIDEYSLKEISKEIESEIFWKITKKGVIIEAYQYKQWLEGNGFYKYYPDGHDGYVFVKVENNLIDNTTEVKIKDYVLAELLKLNQLKVYEYMASNSKYFKDEFLNILSEANINFKDDTIDTSYVYFRNCAVEVTKNGFNLIDYFNLDGFVWRKQIIDFDFKLTKNIDCDFSKFIELVSNREDERINTLTSTIGYLMHSFKTSANNKAIILNDETISENPNGGSGKGIFWNALSKVKKVSDVNGKSFSFEKSFPYQTVSADTQVLVFDDVQKNFKFENLFSVITEGITLEKKNKDAIKIPVSKSPKILITTNYTLGGVGGSFERRKFEIEFSSHFSSKHTPLNEFGRMLFDEWDYREWLNFYNYMLTCLQMYLINGLVSHEFKNLETRKLIKETSFEFYEWANIENIPLNERHVKTFLYNNFLEEYPDWKKYNLSQKRFWIWIEKYCDFNKFKLNKGRDSMGSRYVEICS